MQNANDILKRLKKAYGLKTDTELAQFLGVDQSTISTWKKRKTLNLAIIIAKCKNDLNLDWLFTGRGKMRLEEKEGESETGWGSALFNLGEPEVTYKTDKEKLRHLEEENKILKAQIQLLKEVIKELKK